MSLTCFGRRSVEEVEVATTGGSGGKGLLFDRKLFEPEKFERLGTWKEWSEDFIDWIEQSEPKLAEMLNFARDSKDEITPRWVPMMS